MSSVAAIFPTLMAELLSGLRQSGREDLADQLKVARVAGATFDDESNAGWVHLEPARELNVVELNIVGRKYETSVSVPCETHSVLDLDNFGRVIAIEILVPTEEVKDELRRCVAA